MLNALYEVVVLASAFPFNQMLIIFWKRSVEHWVEPYVWRHKYIRERSELEGMQIMGPSMQEGATAEYVW